MFKLSYYNFYIPVQDSQVYLIYNSLSNSLIELPWEDGMLLSRINSMEIHYLDNGLVDILKSNNMIINEEIDEFRIVSERASSNRNSLEKSDRLFMVIAPTNACNMNCPYCYQGDKSVTNADTKYLSQENMDSMKNVVIKALENPFAEPIKNISIEWFGGEPLLRKGVIEEFSDFLIERSIKHKVGLHNSIITNGTLLTPQTWSLLDKCRIYNLQITIDGSEDSHDKNRMYISGKGTYRKIMDNLANIPNKLFKIVLRINGDKKVFQQLPEMFQDFEERGLWPQKSDQLSFHWAPKFYDFKGYNQDKNLYYTSYDYQKSREDFANLRLNYYNTWAANNDLRIKGLKVEYPRPSEFYCPTVESPNSLSIDDGGFVHKCYNTINRKEERIQHLKDFDPYKEGMDHFKHFSKADYPECKTCKVLPICDETCNLRFVDKVESKICTAWKFFMEDRMKKIYKQKFIES